MHSKTENRIETFERDALPLHDMLHRQAIKLAQNNESAEDLVQETFLHAFHRFDTFAPGTNLSAWMTRILFNQFVNTYRRRKNEGIPVELAVVEPFLSVRDLATSEAALKTPEEMMRDKTFLETLEGPVLRELAGLDVRFRDVLLLNTVGGESYAEISLKLDVPIGTVMSRLHRAKATMRERLAEARFCLA